MQNQTGRMLLPHTTQVHSLLAYAASFGNLVLGSRNAFGPSLRLYASHLYLQNPRSSFSPKAPDQPSIRVKPYASNHLPAREKTKWTRVIEKL